METPAPLAHLLQALEVGDLATAKAAAAALQRSGPGSTQLAAEVLHELRQPLLGVKAYAQLLAEETGTVGPLKLLLAQVERMEQIISDFVRLSSDRTAPQQRLSLATPVWAAAKLFSLNPDSARISLEVEAPETITVQGNARLLEQLTLNLLNNARDAMGGRGRIKVLLTLEGSAPVLYVADWGPGIPREMREKIFEPYVSSSKRGTGLGLAVCKRIAQEHRAQISLAPTDTLPDQPPPSTVFRISFPATVEVPTTQRKRVLIVDDESIIRMVFRDLLGKEFEVLEAGTAEEALDLLRNERVDLIVTDKNLPGLSGLALAQQARMMNPQARILLMTGYPSLGTTQEALELGVMDYLLKPFDDIRQVRALIRAAIASPPAQPRTATGRRVDVIDDNATSSRTVMEALTRLGLEPRLISTTEIAAMEPPMAVVVSWDFTPAYGRKALELGKALAQGAPFIVLVEHLTMETTLDSLRAGAIACLPRLFFDAPALSRELSRALKLGTP
ncbi:hybrid histidine protein kinase/response regulator SinK [Hyalangium minutum]|uniref:histidine kinase n=1 Tax=Hyalangium minutum TaxID=394096 RepID=A0A085WNQ4_9BACT|nr:hybrid histidine protein kinase/response regulator SinK [Hyalangium minutum]KFE69317.1 sensor histidine kinase/response rgulator [Hyalangium minutum]